MFAAAFEKKEKENEKNFILRKILLGRIAYTAIREIVRFSVPELR